MLAAAADDYDDHNLQSNWLMQLQVKVKLKPGNNDVDDASHGEA